MFDKIKDTLSVILFILRIPFLLICILKDIIKFSFSRLSDSEKKEAFLRILTENGFNTKYEVKCPECEYSNKVMIGGGHTSDSDGYFSSDLVYCPDCKEPLVKSSVHYSKKSDVESKINNEVCPKCGEKTIPYNIKNRKTRLKCPKCGCHNLEITNLHEFWMT